MTKHHIKEIHQTQEGMKTILRGVHYPDGHQKLPVRLKLMKFRAGVIPSRCFCSHWTLFDTHFKLVFRITTPRSLKKVVTVTGFK